MTDATNAKKSLTWAKTAPRLFESRESREPRAESREPRAESREPRAESREPRAESREPRAESREPRAESREPRAESREPRAESREPRAESREPRAESREPRAESREPRAESREPRAESREPRAESREPRAESREPRAESREPRAESREPRAESREPRAESPSSGRGMNRPHGCRAGRPPESPSPAPGEPSDDTTVLEEHPRRAARRVASALRRCGAVLVLTLAALAAPLSAAQAQTVLWEQTMTVGTSFTDLGWDDSGTFTGAALSDADETFEYDGHTYDLHAIFYGASELILDFDPDGAGDVATKATRDKLTFHVGASAYNLGTGAFIASIGISPARINWGRVLNWSAGDMLALKITTTDPGAPGLTATAGVAAVTLNWTAPTSSGGTAITGYEYRQWNGDGFDVQHQRR